MVNRNPGLFLLWCFLFFPQQQRERQEQQRQNLQRKETDSRPSTDRLGQLRERGEPVAEQSTQPVTLFLPLHNLLSSSSLSLCVSTLVLVVLLLSRLSSASLSVCNSAAVHSVMQFSVRTRSARAALGKGRFFSMLRGKMTTMAFFARKRWRCAVRSCLGLSQRVYQ